eukprot:649945-Rhodomonas_salina.2
MTLGPCSAESRSPHSASGLLASTAQGKGSMSEAGLSFRQSTSSRKFSRWVHFAPGGIPRTILVAAGQATSTTTGTTSGTGRTQAYYS